MVTHRGIITGLFAEYSYDYRRIVPLNPPALSVHKCVHVSVEISRCIRVSAVSELVRLDGILTNTRYIHHTVDYNSSNTVPKTSITCVYKKC